MNILEDIGPDQPVCGIGKGWDGKISKPDFTRETHTSIRSMAQEERCRIDTATHIDVQAHNTHIHMIFSRARPLYNTHRFFSV